MFSGTSFYADSVDQAMLIIVGISVFFLLGIVAVMIYFVFRYSRKRNPVASQIHGNLTLEIVWIIIPFFIVMGMFWLGWKDFYDLREKADIAMEVKVEGRMWKWSFTYPNGKLSDTLYIPVDKVTKLVMKSVDVNHSFYIPAFRIKEDVIASRETYMILTPIKRGTFDIACAEYCGLNHSYMYTQLKVVAQSDFDDWLAIMPADSSGAKQDTTSKVAPKSENVAEASLLPDMASENSDKKEKSKKDDAKDDTANDLQNHRNFRLLTKYACVSCHSTDGSNTIGPSFTELGKGYTTVVTSGKERRAKIDAKYIRNSIIDPDVDIVKGYKPYMMPSMKGRISDKDLNSIVDMLLGKK